MGMLLSRVRRSPLTDCPATRARCGDSLTSGPCQEKKNLNALEVTESLERTALLVDYLTREVFLALSIEEWESYMGGS